jgi:hypothetical protein
MNCKKYSPLVLPLFTLFSLLYFSSPFFVTGVFTIVFLLFFSPLSCFSYLYLYLLFYIYIYLSQFFPGFACKTSPILTHTGTTQHNPTIHLYLTGPIP